MSAGNTFPMSVRIPSNNPLDVKMRVAMALVEAAVDRVLAKQQSNFERSCHENDAPVDRLADLLLWHHEEMSVWREQTLAEMRLKMRAWFTEGDSAATLMLTEPMGRVQ